MKNKITVRIGGVDYTIIASESEDYIREVADYVDTKVCELLNSSAKVTALNAAVLASINLCDEFFKARQSAENLRSQLTMYLEEANNAKAQLKEANRLLEIYKKNDDSVKLEGF